MAKIEQRGVITAECVVRLTEAEMRFLDGMTGYGWKSFIETFHKHMGTSYTRYHLDGGQLFFESIRTCIMPILKRTDDARAVFTGEKEARHPPKPEASTVPSTNHDAGQLNTLQRPDAEQTDDGWRPGAPGFPGNRTEAS